MQFRSLPRFAALAVASLVGMSASAAPFIPGNLVISRVGDGVTAISGNSAAVFLDEYTTGGVNVNNSLLLPNASGNRLTLSGSTTSVGQLQMSYNGQYLTIGGVDAPAGTTTPNSNGSFPGRTIARIDLNQNVDTSTRYLGNGSALRSTASADGSGFWLAADTGAGNTGGVRYIPLGGSTATQLFAQSTGAATNARVVNVAQRADGNAQLYVSASTGVGTPVIRGVSAVGNGLPTVSGQTVAAVINGTGADSGPLDSAYDYFFASPTVLYVADDDASGVATGGLKKFTFNGTSWSLAYTATLPGTIGFRSIAGYVDAGGSGAVTLYAISAVSSATGQTQLVSLSDTLSGNTAPTINILATSPTGTAFRGVEVVPEPGTLGLAAVAALGMLARRRRNA